MTIQFVSKSRNTNYSSLIGMVFTDSRSKIYDRFILRWSAAKVNGYLLFLKV